jgi:predicted enzyme related to lactoylglutathione lyase
MTSRLESVHPVLMSRDVTRSIRFYEMLGFALAGQDAEDDPKYARVQRDGVELHLQWHDAKEWEYPNDRPTYRFLVHDVDELYKQFRATSGVSDIRDVFDAPWGTREFHVRDPDLNGLQFYRSR